MYRRANIRAPSDSVAIPLLPNGSRSTSSRPSSTTSKPLHASLTPRITLFLLILFILFLFTRLALFPQDGSFTTTAGGHRFLSSRHKLIPRDYLNASASDPAPFSFCPHFGPGDDLAAQYGNGPLHRSVLHSGSGARVQKVIHKAMRGLPITISVLGGSISACHGAGDDPLTNSCYPAQMFHWWNDVFPHPASELTNGARRKTDSGYFAYCSSQHLPDQTDLVILEFDTDDQYDDVAMEHFELLVRSILIRPDEPAIIVLGHFAPQLQGIHGFGGPEQLHTLVAQFYDLPHVSAKGALYHQYLHNPSLAIEKHFTDMILANSNGHKVIADVLIHYLQGQICHAWSTAKGYSFEVPMLDASAIDPDSHAEVDSSKGLFRGMDDVRKGEQIDDDDDEGNIEKRKIIPIHVADPATAHLTSFVPPFLLTTRANIQGGSDAYRFKEVKPYCVSANDLINPLPATLFVGSGWHVARPKIAVLDSMTPADSYYWHATYPKSKLRVPVKTGSGDVAVWYLTQRADNDGKPPSEVQCWVDNNYPGAVTINGFGEGEPAPAIRVIDHFVEEGSHYVECQLQGVEGVQVADFKLLGIFAS